MPRIPWRRWNAALHRDLGYLAVGLTVVYAISGIAVNHTDDWNPNYSTERVEKRFAPLPITDRDTMALALVDVLALPGPPKGSFRPSPAVVQLFYDGWSVEADVERGVAMVEVPRDRVLLRDMNTLHLNRPKGAWTWIADAYGLVLVFLAISGTILLKGRQGVLGRGKWFVIAGIAIPVLFLAFARGP